MEKPGRSIASCAADTPKLMLRCERNSLHSLLTGYLDCDQLVQLKTSFNPFKRYKLSFLKVSEKKPDLSALSLNLRFMDPLSALCYFASVNHIVDFFVFFICTCQCYVISTDHLYVH